ncbi:MAG: alpha/beta hydrolase [Acetobacter orientalis]|uniref:alpha/beta hydrolase n=1 Tax=Acetobacter orientalis TaxID=146474 RepID=UPI0039ECCF69
MEGNAKAGAFLGAVPSPTPMCPDPVRPHVASRLLLAWLAKLSARRRKRAAKIQGARQGEGADTGPLIPEPPRTAPTRAVAQADFLKALRIAMDKPSFPIALSALQVRKVVTLHISGAAGPMQARLYLPRGRIRGAVLFLHGGGFVHCGLNSHHGICCRLARISGAAVLLPDYRLAPEHPFPAAADDALAAYKWLTACCQRLWGGKVAVAGDSAGGNLAAVVAQDAKAGRAPRPVMQLLYYPSLYGAQEFASHSFYAEGYFLSRASMQWYGEQYIAHPQDWTAPRFVPGHQPDLSGLPPAVIITAECDPMRDEGAAYAHALKKAGVPVRYQCYPGALHGFLNFYACMPYGKKALRLGGRALRKLFEHA